MKIFLPGYLMILLSVFFVEIKAQCVSGEVEVQIEIETDAYGYEGYWELVSADSICGDGTILSGGNTNVGCMGGGQQNGLPGGYGNSMVITSMTACIAEGEDFRIAYVDDYGDGGFKFKVLINGYEIETFEGSGAFEYFTFTAAEPADFDLTLISVDMKAYQSQGNIDVPLEIMNNGTQTITSLTANYEVDNGSTISQQVSGLSIAHGETTTTIHPTPWSPTADGSYDIRVWYSDLNGSNPDNDPSDDEIELSLEIGPGIPNVLDSYLLTPPVVVEIASSQDQINDPTDLDFHPTLTKKELWVVNKDSENTGSSTVTISNAGEENQSEVWRRDGNAWHFMSLTTGIAFSENSNFGTSPGVYDANHNGGQPFTGPALWSSDMSVYAQPSGGNGSHLDMLHESPECQGIAHEVDNVFWVFDGYNDDIVRYNFNDDHGPGNDDHSDGEVLRFSDVNVDKDSDDEVVSHLVYDKNTDWLYVVDHGNHMVFRMDTKSGSIGGVPNFGPFEPLQQYNEVTGYDWEVVADSGLLAPAGIDIIDDRMIVSDYELGVIIIYDISSMPAVELKRLNIGAEGIMGVKIGPEGKIWYVDHEAETVNRVDWLPTPPAGVDNLAEGIDVKLYPNPSSGQVRIYNNAAEKMNYEVYNQLGQQLHTGSVRPGLNNLSLHLPKGWYNVRFVNADQTESVNEKLIIR